MNSEHQPKERKYELQARKLYLQKNRSKIVNTRKGFFSYFRSVSEK